MQSDRPLQVCITLDLEEDHAGLSQAPPAYESTELLPIVVERLKALGVPLTVFVAGNFLENQGKRLDAFRSLEFHSHAYYHPALKDASTPAIREKNFRQGLSTFKDFFGKSAEGFRAPYGIFKKSDFPMLRESGVQFDSSLFPCFHVSGFRPWLSSSPSFDERGKMTEFPISSLFGLRVPYSFSYMQLLGLTPYRACLRAGLIPNPLIFNFHLHDLMQTTAAQHMSPFFRKMYGPHEFNASWALFERWIGLLKERNAVFTTMSPLYKTYRPQALASA